MLPYPPKLLIKSVFATLFGERVPALARQVPWRFQQFDQEGLFFRSVGPCEGPTAANFARSCLEQALFSPFFSQTLPQNPVQLTNEILSYFGPLDLSFDSKICKSPTLSSGVDITAFYGRIILHISWRNHRLCARYHHPNILYRLQIKKVWTSTLIHAFWLKGLIEQW